MVIRVPEAKSVIRLGVFLLIWKYFLGFSLSPSLANSEKHRLYERFHSPQLLSVRGNKEDLARGFKVSYLAFLHLSPFNLGN